VPDLPSDRRDLALDYARRGWSVFPLHSIRRGRCSCGIPTCANAGKHPRTPHGLKDASADPATIRAWWTDWPDANIGLPTGTHFTVLDVDPKAGGDEALRQLEARHGRLTDTWRSLTGGGGLHVFFAAVLALGNSTSLLGPGLDIRGEGGYVVAPGSAHASGHPYVWELGAGPDEGPLAVMPPWMQEALVRPRGTGQAADDAEWVRRFTGVGKGQRNDMATRLAGLLARRGLTAGIIAEILLGFGARCTPPIDRAEAAAFRDIAQRMWDKEQAKHPPSTSTGDDYLEPIATFLAEPDTPSDVIFPELLPTGVMMLLHGEPRARKSLVAFELALAAATGTAPFGLRRFTPSAPMPVLYVQEEDPRPLTRIRLRALVTGRTLLLPETLYVAVRRGINLDDPDWVERLRRDIVRLDIKLLVLDAARRLSAKTDEGPAKVRELVAVLRGLITQTGVTIVIVHHDVKPPVNVQDQRRRSQRASGGDWFAACECPVHVERVGARESLVFPEDFKFTADPAPFTFACETHGELITRLVGTDTSTEHAERAGLRGKILDWLRANGPASKMAMQRAGLARWETLAPVVEALCKEGKLDGVPGRQKGSFRYFVPSTPGSAEWSAV
jgi:Bifunctional DNA primase/polymerase, N-terminal/AAA domain